MSRPRKRSRRSKAEIAAIRDALYRTVRSCRPATVRQIYYQLVSQGVIEKTEAEYKSTVCRLLTKMRKEREIPFYWIADNSRWMRKPRTHDNLEAALEQSIEFYRRRLWTDVEAYVEIWLEKEALSGVFYPITSKWDVPLMVTRGYPSLSFVSEAAQVIDRVSKPTYLYYFGDHDPSGADISRHIEESLSELSSSKIVFRRMAVTESQIQEWNLPTRPTKKTDSRAKNFRGESVEIDAIPIAKLRALIEQCIARHIDEDLLERNEEIEDAERDSGLAYIRAWRKRSGK